ncbi:MAG: hypothetical protein JWM82_1300 [Myxococcales bacterium]|nr:hypothetical protein [Myxococcales bacterium]
MAGACPRLAAPDIAAISDGTTLAQHWGKEITHMKIMILALTLAGSFASGCGGDGGSDASTLGCNASNTTAAPADGLITAFNIPGGGVQADVPVGPAEAAPSFTTNGALHITLDKPVISTSQVLIVDLPFPKCVDATAFTGLQFTISGSLSGCVFGEGTQDSAHLHADGSSVYAAHGIGGPGVIPNTTVLTADQITPTPQTLRMPFAAQSHGVPETPTDTSKLTWIDWVFAVAPQTPGGPTACKADLTIADVRFYRTSP